MSWVRFESKMPTHPKVAPLSDAAFRLHMTATCWCGDHMTDGLLPRGVPASLTMAPRGKALAKVVAELVTAELWELTADGYEIHDYLVYNLSRAQHEESLRLKAEAGRLGGVRSGQSRRSKTEAEPKQVLEQVLKQNRSTTSSKSEAKPKPVSVSIEPKDQNAAAEENLRPFSTERPVSATTAETLAQKAARYLTNATAASFDSPANWPEVQKVAFDFAESMGLRPPRLGQMSADRGVYAIVALIAAGFSDAELEQAASAAKTDAWLRDPAANRGLSSLSVEVVRRLLEKTSGKQRIRSAAEVREDEEMAASFA